MCLKSLVKCLFIVFNFLFAALGLVMLALGIVAIVNPQSIDDLFRNLPNVTDHVTKAGFNLQGIIKDSAIFMIVVGAVVACIALLGCCGAWYKNRTMLNAYIIIMVIILLAEIGLVIFAAINPSFLQEKVQQGMLETLKQYQDDGELNKTAGTYKMPTREIEVAWASMQFVLGCCGAYGYTDYTQTNLTMYKVPVSCCKQTGGPGKIPTTTDAFNNLDRCLEGIETFINDKNCFDAAAMIVEKSARLAVGIGAAILAVEIVLILVAIVLWRSTVTKSE